MTGREATVRLVWLTDIHLNFLPDPIISVFVTEVVAARPDAVLVGGDIGEAGSVAGYLERLADAVRVPVYFVLGNHDYYRGSVAGVRAEIGRLVCRVPNLIYLSESDPVPLTARTVLVGHDGWGDGGFGNAAGTRIALNDFWLIDELAGWTHPERLAVLARFGVEAAAHLRAGLTEGLTRHDHAFVLTHVPPFREAAWHEGRVSDPDWLPYFACRAAGDAMREVLADRSDRRLTVLCGHTHGSGECRPAANVLVHTGGAEYRRPVVQRVFEVE